MSFCRFIRQSTAVDVLIGPFVDSTDGDTAETALTIAAADVRLSKNGQNMAAKNDATACTHDEEGMYNCELDATDTNTVGSLVLLVHKTGALHVRHEYQVLEEAIYDALFDASADGFDANGRVDVGSWLGNAVTASGGNPDVNVESIDASAITAASIATSALDGKGDWNIGKTGYSISGTITTLDGLNNLSAADVNSQVGTALSDIHLDHIFAVDYDPASIPGVAGALLNELIEDDGDGNARFTAAALSMVPTGGGDLVYGDWKWSTTTTASDPGSGNVRVNNATYSSVTEVYISAFSDAGYNAGSIIEQLDNGDVVMISEAANGSNYIRLLATGAPTDNGAWYTIPVSFTEAGSAIGNNQLARTYFQFIAENLQTVIDHLTDIKGAGWTTTDSLEAIRDRGDAAWITATGFSTHSAADVANAVWDETVAGYTTVGTFGAELLVEADLPSNFGSLSIDGSGRVSSDVDRINGATVLGNGTAGNLWRG